jgi:hypothetical protein
MAVVISRLVENTRFTPIGALCVTGGWSRQNPENRAAIKSMTSAKLFQALQSPVKLYPVE